MKNRIIIGIGLVFISIISYRTTIKGGVGSSKPVTEKKAILLPGIFNAHGIFSSGTITSKGLEIDPESIEPITHASYQKILSNPNGAILGLVVTRLNNNIVYNVYNGSGIRTWLRSHDTNPMSNQPIVKVKYYITPAAWEPFGILSIYPKITPDLFFFYAIEGNADAQATVGNYFLEKKQYNLAKKWLNKASDQGSTYAEMVFALMYK